MNTLALDLGGTNLRAGLFDPERPDTVEPVGQWHAPETLAGFEKKVSGLIEQHEVERLGVAVPGLATGTTCRWIPNLPYLDGIDLAEIFPGKAVALGNDAQLALLAEAASGAAKGMTDVILLAIGTGIGSAVLAGSRIVRGARGGAASFGWACADTSDAGHDRDGWLERNAAGRALDRIARSAGIKDGATLIGRAREGDEEAQRLLQEPATALGTSLAGAVALLDPQAILVSGGVAAALDVLGPSVLTALRRQLPPHLRGADLLPGAFGPRASLIGAGIAACGSPLWEQFG